MAHICFVGAPRSGSSLICDMMPNFKGVDSRYEIFHPKGTGMHTSDVVDAMRRAVAKRYRDSDYEQLALRLRSRPLSTIEQIRGLKPASEHFSFKIFQNHLPFRVVERELLPRDDFHFVIVRRSLFDSYISSRKAKQLQNWKKTDTTGLKIQFDVEEYIDFCRAKLKWYNWWHEALPRHNRPVVTLNYGDYPFDPVGLTGAISEALAATGLHLEVGAITQSGRDKQDTSTGYRDKIEDYDETLATLRQLDIIPVEIAA